MKNFFENFKTYLKLILSTILALLGIIQMVEICHAVQISDVSMNGFYILEIVTIFIVAIVFFASWWLDTLNQLLEKPVSDKLLIIIKSYVRLFIALVIVLFLNYQTIEIITIVAKHINSLGTFYAIEIGFFLLVADLFIAKYFYTKIKEIKN